MATTKKRKTATPAAPRRRRAMAAKRPAVKRRRSPAKKGFLSEMFNPAMAQGAAKTVLSGAIGGMGAGLIGKFMPASVSEQQKAIYTVAGGFIVATLLKMPNVGAGMAGVGAFQLLQSSGMLAEDGNYDYANDMEALPMVLNEDQAAFLSEAYLSEAYLSEEDYQVGYAPEFGYM